MHLIGLKGRNIILKSLQIEMLVMFLIRSMAKETIKQARIPNIVKKNGYKDQKVINNGAF